MKQWFSLLASLGAPLLIVLALLASQHRDGRERSQALPPLLVGSGLIISAAASRRRHRSRLLKALQASRQKRL